MPRAGRRLGGSYVMGATPAGAKHGLDAFSARRTNAPNRSSTRSRGGPPSAEAENGGGRDRTADLKVMSLASYHCSTPQWSVSPGVTPSLSGVRGGFVIDFAFVGVSFSD